MRALEGWSSNLRPWSVECKLGDLIMDNEQRWTAAQGSRHAEEARGSRLYNQLTSVSSEHRKWIKLILKEEE